MKERVGGRRLPIAKAVLCLCRQTMDQQKRRRCHALLPSRARVQSQTTRPLDLPPPSDSSAGDDTSPAFQVCEMSDRVSRDETARSEERRVGKEWRYR